jgi:ketosteroid isomerase-like protein
MGAGKDLWAKLETLTNKQAWAEAALLYTVDAVDTDPTGRYEGRDAILAYQEGLDETFHDAKLEASMLIEEGETVVAEDTWRATNTGPISMPDGTEIPATGKMLEMHGVSVITVRDGKFAIQHHYFDTAAMASQLGLMPGT